MTLLMLRIGKKMTFSLGIKTGSLFLADSVRVGQPITLFHCSAQSHVGVKRMCQQQKCLHGV